ncbi:OprD family porin [Pseudomonas sp.]|uniref:OprD family porin n=1 Tax=Pseudomonas sp. TaxID=306 RepID=UPI003C77673E
MQMKTCSALALAISVATLQLAYAADEVAVEQLAQGLADSSQGQSKGFIEDSSLTLLSRNVALYRNLKNNNNAADSLDGVNSSQNYVNEWGQAEMLTFTSGFTQGTVGFGVDAFANGAVRLTGGAGTGGSNVLPGNSGHCDTLTGTCQGQDAYGLAGGAVKLRVSETELKVGNLQPNSPVFGYSDLYLMPQHFTGGLVTSNEISGLALQGGHFTSGNAENSTNQDGDLGTTYGQTAFKRADFVGADYSFSDTLSGGLHASKYQDVWQQYYADLYHSLPLGEETALNTSIAYYKTDDSGDATAGEINTDAYSVALALVTGAHSFTFAHQRVNGDTPFDYLGVETGDGKFNPAGSIWLANSSQFADFNAPGEKSYKLQYDLDAASFGVPGLSFMVRYVKGTGADGTAADAEGAYGFYNDLEDGKEWERDIQVAYVLQDGPAKDLSFTLRQATYRGNDDMNATNSGSDNDEFRLITAYPLDIL